MVMQSRSAISGRKDSYSATLVERVLHISVQDLSPQAYMDALGFTQEEKDWAALLYSVLAEEQYTGTEDSDGTGYWNTDCRALRLRLVPDIPQDCFIIDPVDHPQHIKGPLRQALWDITFGAGPSGGGVQTAHQQN